MNEEIKIRLSGLERIVLGLHHNAELLQYMSFNLHQETFNLINNTGLFWIWTQILGIQIINLYKVMMKEEKFSFPKIVNVAKENKVEVNYAFLENETGKVIEIFNKTDIECI